jgi:hypothetical protein
MRFVSLTAGTHCIDRPQMQSPSLQMWREVLDLNADLQLTGQVDRPKASIKLAMRLLSTATLAQMLVCTTIHRSIGHH